MFQKKPKIIDIDKIISLSDNSSFQTISPSIKEVEIKKINNNDIKKEESIKEIFKENNNKNNDINLKESNFSINYYEFIPTRGKYIKWID